MRVTFLSILEVDIVLMKITMKAATMMVVTAVTLMQTQTIVSYVSVMKMNRMEAQPQVVEVLSALQLHQLLLQLHQLLQLQVIFRKKKANCCGCSGLIDICNAQMRQQKKHQ